MRAWCRDEVMEQVTGYARACWATTQFLSYRASAGSARARSGGGGARASDQPGTRDGAGRDREILTVVGALGHRPTRSRASGPPARRSASGRLPPRPLMNRHQGTIMDRFESKLAGARPYWELNGVAGSETRHFGCGSPSSATRRPRSSRSSAISCRSASARRWPTAGGNSSTTRCHVTRRRAHGVGPRRRAVHAVADGFGHGPCTSGPRTARSSAPQASRRWSARHGPVNHGGSPSLPKRSFRSPSSKDPSSPTAEPHGRVRMRA